MQQAIYNTIGSTVSLPASSGVQTGQSAKTGTAKVPRWTGRKWDLVGVVALMGACAAYGVFALAYVGL